MRNIDAIIKVRRSSLWAAYGDAMGFITELASSSLVHRRIQAERVERLVSWSRQVGGRFGIEVQLPIGCYSDDTQLRLATSRAIRGDGAFDVEVFAKVELPIWRAYALGGGVGTKSAATSMAKPNAQWCTNFYSSKSVRYITSGGNGAAMRIQPHVWSAPPSKHSSDIIHDIIRNTVTSHGHPRAIVGAAFHGLCLLHVMREDRIPGPDEWRSIANELRGIVKIVSRDDDLSTFWLPLWEQASQKSFDGAIEEVIKELEDAIAKAERAMASVSGVNSAQQAYAELVKSLDGFSNSSRGSAIVTAILAAFLAAVPHEHPLQSVITAANLLSSDTDTISTMAASIAGALSLSDPPEVVADADYITYEATRLAAISQGRRVDTFTYPDLLYWKAPEAELDCVGCYESGLALAGLGQLRSIGEQYIKRSGDAQYWQWFTTSFGQCVLLKCRSKPISIRPEMLSPHVTLGASDMTPSSPPAQPSGTPQDEARTFVKADQPVLSLDDATDIVIRSEFNYETTGRILMQLAEQNNGIEQAVAFAAIVAKAKQARLKRDRRK